VTRALLGGLAALYLAGCHGKTTASIDIRPALTTTVGAWASGGRQFVGHVEGRYTTPLAFRVGGRIARRSVSVGDHVKAGQEIAALDTRSLELAAEVAAADLAGLIASRENAATTLGRQTTLLARGAVARASFDDARASRAVAVASADEAKARLDKARQELSFGILRANFDGVVTRIDFDVDQVVAQNAPIAEVVRPDTLDFVFDAPDSVARDLRPGDSFTVHGADVPTTALAGKIRETSPAADRATRTRRVWVGLETVPERLRIGTTMYAEPSGAATTRLRAPLAAVVEGDGPPSVWVVEGGVVRRRGVTLGAREGNDVVVLAGLRPGERVVAAGVHSLREGQQVNVREDGAR
jgi:RND family efflux transporter MFP subunit